MRPAVETLFEDEEIVVRAQPGDPGRPTLVTFGDYTFRPEIPGFWASAPAAGMGWPAIGFVARRPNWFPAASVAAAAAAVHARAGPLRVGYGYSMGGYGALKHGRLLGLTHALSLSPQLSIAPADLPHDPRYHPDHDPTLHAGMRVRAGDLAPRAWAVFDPLHAGDAQNMALLDAPALERLPVRGLYHGTPSLLRGRAPLEDALRCLLDGDAARLRRALRDRRRLSPHWHAGLGAALLGRGPTERGGELLDRARAMGLDAETEVELLGEALATEHAVPGRPLAHRHPGPVQARLLALRGLPAGAHLARSLRLSSIGQDRAARWAAEQGLAEAGPDAKLMTQLGHLLLQGGEPAAALLQLEASAGMAPLDPWTWVGVSVARRRLGDVFGAVTAAEEAARLGPGSFPPQLALGAARLAEDRPALAEEAYRRAAHLGGGDRAERGLARALSHRRWAEGPLRHAWALFRAVSRDRVRPPSDDRD